MMQSLPNPDLHRFLQPHTQRTRSSRPPWSTARKKRSPRSERWTVQMRQKWFHWLCLLYLFNFCVCELVLVRMDSGAVEVIASDRCAGTVGIENESVNGWWSGQWSCKELTNRGLELNDSPARRALVGPKLKAKLKPAIREKQGLRTYFLGC